MYSVAKSRTERAIQETSVDFLEGRAFPFHRSRIDGRDSIAAPHESAGRATNRLIIGDPGRWRKNAYFLEHTQLNHKKNYYIRVFISFLCYSKAFHLWLRIIFHLSYHYPKVVFKYIGRSIRFREQRSRRNQPPPSDDRGFVSWSSQATEGYGGETGMLLGPV